MADRKCSVCLKPGHTKRTCELEKTYAADDAEVTQVQRAHTHVFRYGDDDNGHSGSFCACGMEEPDANPDMPIAADSWSTPAPIYTGSKPGPGFVAQFPGICERCGDGFEPGEQVRADGQGGYECCGPDAEVHTGGAACCDACEGDETSSETVANAQAWERPTAANVKMPSMPPEKGGGAAEDQAIAAQAQVITDLFTSPAPVTIVPPAERDDDPLTTARGYLIKDPRTGDYNRYKNGNIKPFTRTSTLVKAASDQKGITDWEQRNIVMGAVLRPDLVGQARGLNHEDHKDQLQSIARMLGEAAGSRSGSDAGTMFHTITEKLDAGTARLDQVPEQYRELARKYVAALADAGFRVVPHMIERSVFLSQFGGIGGTFDRILFHEPTSMYVMSDVKSGKSMDFGWSEIEAQEWVYTTAYNEFGTWNHTTKVWEPPQFQVATDYGLVMHTPVKGKLAGQVQLLRTDLARGGRHAELCATVRAADSVKAKAVAWSVPDAWEVAQGPAERDWERDFAAVTEQGQAGILWQEAKLAGIGGMQLNALVQLAQSALRVAGVTG